MPTTTTIIAVDQLDCAAEEQVLRKAVGSLPGVASVQCNVVTRRMTVLHDAAATPPAMLSEKVRSVGMTPTVVSPAGETGVLAGADCGATACAPGDAYAAVKEDTRPWWRKYGLFILAGLLAAGAETLYFAGVKETSPIVIAMSVASILLGGLPTLKKGWIALRTFTLNINFLMTVAIVGGAVIGAWPEIALVTFLFALAELIEAKALDRARNAVKGLMAMAPDEASVKQPDGSWKVMTAGAVPVGAVVQVKPGERLALDGVVVAGESSVNQAPVTGESVPVDKKAGDKVFAGTINESGVLEFKTTGGKDQTTLAKIIRTVQEAQGSRAPTQRFVDNFAKVYTPLVCIVAALVAVVPWLAFDQPFYSWLYKALVLLVIACPCALVISTPVTVVSGLTAAAKRGILIKGGVHLENGRKLKVVALDKTGTITEGRPRVTDVQPVGGASKDEVLRIAASLDALSQHPVAIAVVAAWSGERASVEAFKSLTGRGVEGRIDGAAYFVGNHRLAEERKVCSLEVEAVLSHFEVQGKTAVVVASASTVLGVIAVADTPRESSVEAVKSLHEMGIKTLMLSGDNQTTASAIAKLVGIDEARGGMLPEDKLAEIERLTKEHGDAIGMVGDGVNDAPALAKSTIGFAMGAAGTDTALETADVALMQDDLRGLPEFVRLSRQTGRVLAQNITFAIGIKVVFFVLTLGGWGTMWMAVIADVGASLLVVGNGLRLLGMRKGPAARPGPNPPRNLA
ncbi:MAG: cadmium-translocating P-type ATPase [Phycisphaeraceae bacterium]|nr:cadmium-translocating P-type ATPase [Phycisphaeraceae bacterium]MBX3404426.1 cadmium-translocating P-type ATPase [Phycisphaeraceae bacterium]MBX3435726.1 cadmium-translocating P-type ATPase [Pirellulales bacterium]MCW5775369.1 cadmium-translocating P-type ATPase [Phycisphaeraceae bacterium]